jgi:hypothetical protein
VLVQRHGHLLYLDLPQPTKGLSVKLSYGNAGIRYVNTLDFVASPKTSTVDVTPPSVPERAVSVNFNGWIFPRSGVALVWVIEVELVCLLSFPVGLGDRSNDSSLTTLCCVSLPG